MGVGTFQDEGLLSEFLFQNREAEETGPRAMSSPRVHIHKQSHLHSWLQSVAYPGVPECNEEEMRVLWGLMPTLGI
jgi:hypothetical protein